MSFFTCRLGFRCQPFFIGSLTLAGHLNTHVPMLTTVEVWYMKAWSKCGQVWRFSLSMAGSRSEFHMHRQEWRAAHSTCPPRTPWTPLEGRSRGYLLVYRHLLVLTMAAQNSIINCKLLLIGNSSVGKSSLLMRFSDEQWLPEDEASATIGVDFRVSG